MIRSTPLLVKSAFIVLVTFLIFPAVALASGMESSGVGIRSNGLANCWIGEGTESAALFWQPAGLVFQKSGWNLQIELKYTNVNFESQNGPKNSMPFFPSGHDQAGVTPRLEPDRLPATAQMKNLVVPVIAASWRSEPAKRDWFRTFAVSMGVMSTTGGGGGIETKFDFVKGGETFNVNAAYTTSLFSIGVPLVAAVEVYRNLSIGAGPVFNWGLVMASNFKSLTSARPDENYNIVNQAPYSASSFGVGAIVSAMYNWKDRIKAGFLFKVPYLQSGSTGIRAYRQGPVTTLTVDAGGNLVRTTGRPGSGRNPIDTFNQQMKSMFRDYGSNGIGQDYGRAVYYDVTEEATTTINMPPRIGFGVVISPVAGLRLYADWYMSLWSQASQKVRFDRTVPGILMNMDIILPGDLKDTQEFGLAAEYAVSKLVDIRLGTRFIPTYVKKNGVTRAFFPDYKDNRVLNTQLNGISVFSANPLTSWMISAGAGFHVTKVDRLDVFTHFNYSI
ncbi:MAG: hypothetical protein WC889_18875, partial [Myxococcota bacterium]